MEPSYENGKVVGASPFIMFDEVEGFDKSVKNFSMSVKNGIKFESSYGFISPLTLKKRYFIGNGMFLEAHNYVRFLELRKNLILEFEVKLYPIYPLININYA